MEPLSPPLNSNTTLAGGCPIDKDQAQTLMGHFEQGQLSRVEQMQTAINLRETQRGIQKSTMELYRLQRNPEMRTAEPLTYLKHRAIVLKSQLEQQCHLLSCEQDDLLETKLLWMQESICAEHRLYEANCFIIEMQKALDQFSISSQRDISTIETMRATIDSNIKSAEKSQEMVDTINEKICELQDLCLDLFNEMTILQLAILENSGHATFRDIRESAENTWLRCHYDADNSIQHVQDIYARFHQLAMGPEGRNRGAFKFAVPLTPDSDEKIPFILEAAKRRGKHLGVNLSFPNYLHHENIMATTESEDMTVVQRSNDGDDHDHDHDHDRDRDRDHDRDSDCDSDSDTIVGSSYNHEERYMYDKISDEDTTEYDSVGGEYELLDLPSTRFRDVKEESDEEGWKSSKSKRVVFQN